MPTIRFPHPSLLHTLGIATPDTLSLDAVLSSLARDTFARCPHDGRLHHTACHAIAFARAAAMPASRELSQRLQNGRFCISHAGQERIVQCAFRCQAQDVALDRNADPAPAKLGQDFSSLRHKRTVSSPSLGSNSANSARLAIFGEGVGTIGVLAGSWSKVANVS